MIYSKFLAVLFLYLSASTAFATPPGYGDGTATQAKISYCSALVNRSGHQSYSINRGYYGIGVQRPLQNNWTLNNVSKPGWFNKDLYIVYTQTTKERYEDYEHRAVCQWELSGYFSFKIRHFDRVGVLVCEHHSWVEDEPELRCP
jgi:hypothetical protein